MLLQISGMSSLMIRRIEKRINNTDVSLPQSDTNIASINLAKGER